MFDLAERNNKAKISMEHAYDEEDTYPGNRGKYKSRIGGTIGKEKTAEDKSGLLNNESSFAL